MASRNDKADHLRTISGAQVIPVSVDAAEAFLGRLNQRGPEETSLALAAVEDDGPMIGVGVLGASPSDAGRVMVAVAPERRRLHIGTDLIHILAVEAERAGLRHLRVSYSVDAVLSDAFVSHCGLRVTRHVVNGVVTAVLAAHSELPG